MTRDDVIALFRAWRGAGLRPPVDKNSVEQANNMVDSFLKQYSAVTAEELQMLVVKLSRLQFWPRFYDVDEALADFRGTKATANKGNYDSYGNDRVSKYNAETRRMLGLPADYERINFMELMAERYAKAHYPKADEGFIDKNKLNLAAQFEFDFECMECQGKMSKDCKFGCHRPFLRVDKFTGEMVMLADSAKCTKHIENPNSYQKNDAGSQRRGGGFSSFGECVGG